MFQSAVAEPVLLLMRRLFADEDIAAVFYQAGGTALALHLGHRKSEDIDLFTANAFDEDAMVRKAGAMGGLVLLCDDGTVHTSINGVRVSFLRYPYPLLAPAIDWEGIRLASIPDIAAMKTAAVSQRAEKKDFFDMFEIFKRMSPAEVKSAFLAKFGAQNVNCYHALRSFFFFDDAESSPDPVSLNATTWDEVKRWFLSREKELAAALLC